ncbi:MAG: NADH-quinone oxidoreductase subunit C [Alphaproteobacteria bacterium]|nr:NADH-quinone oxidoreductase subunit C [Alphaproteobacteria bacterium]
MAVTLEALTTTIESLLGPDLIHKEQAYGELTLTVYAGSILRVLTILRDNEECQFKQLIDICATDYPERTQRFEVVYHLLSIFHNQRLRIKVTTDATIPISSVTGVYACANWYEREAWDMMGIPFTDHPDLRRLLTDYNFEGHPLRKDFPLTGFYEVRYDEEAKRVVYDSVSLPQDYRTFDFLSPWEGMLKGEPTTSSHTPNSSSKDGTMISDRGSQNDN